MHKTPKTFSSRAALSKSTFAKKLLTLMDSKKTNLAVSADVTSAHELLQIADTLGPEICVLKTHIDIIQDFTSTLTTQLAALARQHDFLLFEDRKFADIGNTVKHQYEGGIYKIADWADIINAHVLPGPGIIKGLADVGLNKNRGLLLLAEMSSKGNLLDETYRHATLEMAKQHEDFVFGFITQHALNDEPAWINFTPGVQFNRRGDALGQQYITPEEAIIENKTDIIIVGRGILKANNRVEEAKKYRSAAWDAYLFHSHQP